MTILAPFAKYEQESRWRRWEKGGSVHQGSFTWFSQYLGKRGRYHHVLVEVEALKWRVTYHISEKCVCVRVCMYVSMCAFMCVYLNMCMYMGVYLHMCVCLCVLVHVCIHVCMHARMHVCIYIHIHMCVAYFPLNFTTLVFRLA